MRNLFLVFGLLAAPALAEDWLVLTTDEIRQALTSRVLQYEDGAMQDFFADGRTLYAVGTGESWGKWWANGDRYCSTWPPSETPSCFVVEAQGLEVRFTNGRGDATLGHYVDL